MLHCVLASHVRTIERRRRRGDRPLAGDMVMLEESVSGLENYASLSASVSETLTAPDGGAGPKRNAARR